MKRYLITVMILAMLTIAGFTIPSLLFEWKDGQRLENSEIEASEEVVLVSQTNMTIIEKLQLLGSSMVTTIEMETGKNYTKEEMIVHVQKELKTLSELGILEVDRSKLAYGIDRIGFWIDVQGGTKSMLLWEIRAESETGKLQMLVDDETGKILTVTHIKYLADVSSSEGMEVIVEKKVPEYEGELEAVAEKWAEYLGVELIETTVYDKTIVSSYDEMQKEIDVLIKEGISVTEAAQQIYEEWGLVDVAIDALIERRLYATYEDEGGIAMMGFRKNTGDIFFVINIYI